MPNSKHNDRVLSPDELCDLQAQDDQECRKSCQESDDVVAKIIAQLGSRHPKSVEEYVLKSISSFLHDPPDNDFQFGFLAALLQVHTEYLRGDPKLVADAERLFKARGTEGNLN